MICLFENKSLFNQKTFHLLDSHARGKQQNRVRMSMPKKELNMRYTHAALVNAPKKKDECTFIGAYHCVNTPAHLINACRSLCYVCCNCCRYCCSIKHIHSEIKMKKSSEKRPENQLIRQLNPITDCPLKNREVTLWTMRVLFVFNKSPCVHAHSFWMSGMLKERVVESVRERGAREKITWCEKALICTNDFDEISTL